MSQDVFAIIDRSKQKPLRQLVESMLQDSLALGDRQSQIALERPEICLGTVNKTNADPSHWHCGEREIILQGHICGGLKPDPSWENADFSSLSSRVYDGVYNLLFWCDRSQSLLVTSDYLSTKALYYWQHQELVVISSNLKAFRLLPFVPQQLNPQVLASTLALSHPLSDDTLIAGVKTIPINCAGLFQKQGIDFISRPTPNRAIDTQSTEAELLARLDGLLEKSLETWLAESDRALIALSGGLDSRILLGYLLRSPKKITAATWGELGSDDFKLAVELARATNTEYLTHILSGDTAIAEADLKFPGWQTESFSVNNVPFYWKGWLDLLQAQNLPVVHGFLGGPLGGGRIAKWGVDPSRLAKEVDRSTLDELATWGMTASSDLFLDCATPEFKTYLTEGIARNLTTAFQAIEGDRVYQRLMCLDFYYRQRRYLGNAISKIISTRLPAILPFYTKDNLDFVLQLPPELILGRTIFRKLLLKQFSSLAEVREADKGKLPVYTNIWRKNLDRLQKNRYMWLLFPKTKPRNSALVFSLLLEKNLPILIQTIKDSGNILNNYLDIEKIITILESKPIDPRDRSEVMRLFNICTFINPYSNRLD